MSPRPWSNEHGFEKNFDRDQQQNQSNSYKSESHLQEQQDSYTQPNPKSEPVNFLRSMFEDPSEREEKNSSPINQATQRRFPNPLGQPSISEENMKNSTQSSTPPRVMNKALQNILRRMQSRQSQQVSQPRSYNNQKTIPQILNSPQVQRYAPPTPVQKSQQEHNPSLGFSQLAANQGVQAKTKPVLARRENQSIFRDQGTYHSASPPTGRSFVPPAPITPPVLPPVNKQSNRLPSTPLANSSKQWNARFTSQGVPVASRNYSTERPSFKAQTNYDHGSKPTVGQFQRLSQPGVSNVSPIFSGTPVYSLPTEYHNNSSGLTRQSQSPHSRGIQPPTPLYTPRDNFKQYQSPNQGLNTYSAQSSALRNSSYLSRPAYNGERSPTGPTRPTRTLDVQNRMEEAEMTERLHLIHQTERVKYQILQILSDGSAHVDCRILRTIKKSGRYLGNVALGMILYNLRELFGTDSVTRTYSEGSYIYQLSPEFRAVYLKAFQKAVQKPSTSQTVLKTQKTIKKNR